MISAYYRLEKILNEFSPGLHAFSEEQSAVKPAPGKWSKKEILGHLVDSASNNHQRFVRMQLENGLHLPQYAQDDWVSLQGYQQRAWNEIVTLWETCNKHILHILKNINEKSLANVAVFPEYGTKTLQFIIDDYVDHIEHHFKQIFR